MTGKALALAAILAATALSAAADVPVVRSPSADTRERWAAAELSLHLETLHPGEAFPVVEAVPAKGDCILVGTREGLAALKPFVKPGAVADPGAFVVIHAEADGRAVGVICGADSRGVLDGVYSLLEQKLGIGFYLAGNAAEGAAGGAFTFEAWDLAATPRFGERTAMNWYNFIGGVTSWNPEDYRTWIRQCARMRHTGVMLHTYAYSPFTAFSFNGQEKPLQYIHNTAVGKHWGNRHAKDVRTLVGGEVFAKEGPVFGADCGKIGHGGVTEENRVARAKAMLREVVDYAVNTVGIDFNWSFDIDTIPANPQNIIRTLPEADRFRCGKHWLVRPDTGEGYAYYRNIIRTVMEDYPGITTITAWWRCFTDYTHEGLANTLEPSELPDPWKAEYDAAPAEAKAYGGPGNLFYAKVTAAFRRALDELGHGKVKLGYGSWWLNTKDLHHLFAAANHFQDPDVTAYALEYHMVLDSDAGYRAQLRKTGDRRRLVIVEWAHHDMGQYLGRPYVPPTDFGDKLREAWGAWYVILHWMTRPLDLYFKSLQDQAWSNTWNEPLEVTCRKMAVDYVGAPQSDPMAAYLQAWVTGAPQFMGATKPSWGLGRGERKAAGGVVRGCDARIALLDKMDVSALSEAARNRRAYFRGHEEWIKLFVSATNAEGMEAAIRKYVEKASIDGGMTRGEQGILVQLNLKWLGRK
jgi:hypothetical protein